MPRRCGECRQEGHNRRNCPVIRQREMERLQQQHQRTLQERHQAYWDQRRNLTQEQPRPQLLGRSVLGLTYREGWYSVRETYDDGSSNSYTTRSPPPSVLATHAAANRIEEARRVAPARTITTKKFIPKHIAEQVWELNEPDCMICLSKIDKEQFKLSPCGHNYCKTCYDDTRLDKCGECRQSLY